MSADTEALLATVRHKIRRPGEVSITDAESALDSLAAELERVKAERPTRFELDAAKSRARDAEARLDKALAALAAWRAEAHFWHYMIDRKSEFIRLLAEIEGEK